MQEHFKRTVVISIMVIVAGFALAALGFFVLSKDIDAQVSGIVKSLELVRNRAVRIAGLTSLQKDAAAARSYEQSLDALLPNEDQIYDFTRYLDLLAQTYRVSIEFRFDSSVGPTKDSPGYATFTVGANGSPNDLVQFLKSLETRSSQYLLTVSGVSLSRPAGTYHLSFSGKVYTKE